MEQSKFYRWRPAEATSHKKELVFPSKLQLTYPFQKKAVIVEVGQQEYLKDEELGYHERLRQIDLWTNPEQYTDLDFQLSQIKSESANNLKIWTHINSNVTPDFYHIYQEWTDFSISSKKKTERNYSFLGLYRKFTEADIYNMINLTKKQDKEVKRVMDLETLFASFYGNSIFSIFYTDLEVLRWGVQELEKMEFPR